MIEAFSSQASLLILTENNWTAMRSKECKGATIFFLFHGHRKLVFWREDIIHQRGQYSLVNIVWWDTIHFDLLPNGNDRETFQEAEETE